MIFQKAIKNDGYLYMGTELEVFARAKNWKKYFTSQMKDFITGDVLEVGAGTGNNLKFFYTLPYASWACLEPDNDLYVTLCKNAASCQNVLTINGTIDSVADKKFHSILYIDVIEHIEDDYQEICKATSLLYDNGYLIILVPAHNTLYNEFDKAIGHYRRYEKKDIESLLQRFSNLEIVKLRYLDSVGLLASLANKVVLKESKPTVSQIKFWDNCMVPISIILDKLLAYKAGKSVLAIIRKQ